MTRLEFNQYLHKIEEEKLKGHNEFLEFPNPILAIISFERIHTSNNQVIKKDTTVILQEINNDDYNMKDNKITSWIQIVLRMSQHPSWPCRKEARNQNIRSCTEVIPIEETITHAPVVNLTATVFTKQLDQP